MTQTESLLIQSGAWLIAVTKMDTIASIMVTSIRGTAPAGLFGRTRDAVLRLLLLRPDEQFHLRQIARFCGTGLGAVQRELSALTKMGILHREEKGMQVYFRAEGACPFFPELQGLITKTTGVAGVLSAALLPVADRVKVALVFGSVARGAMTAGSDVDLLLLSNDLTVRDLAASIRQAGQALGREVSLNLYRPPEWARRVSSGHPLAKSILSNPRLVLVGDERELERLAEKRLVAGSPAQPK
jgi:predicted nucleotidyltransferase